MENKSTEEAEDFLEYCEVSVFMDDDVVCDIVRWCTLPLTQNESVDDYEASE